MKEAVMEPKIVERNAFKLVGLLYRGKNENQEIPQLWGQFGPTSRAIHYKQNHGVSYGAMGNYDKNSGEFDYVAAVEVDRLEDIPEDMVGWEIPAQTYAVFSCTLPKIREAYDYALHKWLPDSGYDHTGGIEFELYTESFNPKEASSEFYYYMPIKEK
jgi:AraC family transcriptional regulator